MNDSSDLSDPSDLWKNVWMILASAKIRIAVIERWSFEQFVGIKNPLLNFLNLLSSRALLSYKPLSVKKEAFILRWSRIKSRHHHFRSRDPNDSQCWLNCVQINIGCSNSYRWKRIQKLSFQHTKWHLLSLVSILVTIKLLMETLTRWLSTMRRRCPAKVKSSSTYMSISTKSLLRVHL